MNETDGARGNQGEQLPDINLPMCPLFLRSMNLFICENTNLRLQRRKKGLHRRTLIWL